MYVFQQNITRRAKNQEKIEETKQSSEPNSNMAHMLELSDREFKTTMIGMLKAVIEKIDNIQKHG